MESSTCGWNFTLRDLNQDYGELFIQNQSRYNTSQYIFFFLIVLVLCKNSVDKYITNCFFCLTESWDWKVWIPVYFCRDWHVSQEDSCHWRQQIQWVLSVKHILGISMVDIHLKALNGTEEPEFMSLLGLIKLGFGMLEFGCVEHHKII